MDSAQNQNPYFLIQKFLISFLKQKQKKEEPSKLKANWKWWMQKKRGTEKERKKETLKKAARQNNSSLFYLVGIPLCIYFNKKMQTFVHFVHQSHLPLQRYVQNSHYCCFFYFSLNHYFYCLEFSLFLLFLLWWHGWHERESKPSVL